MIGPKTPNGVLIERIRSIFARRAGRDHGAIAAFARAIGVRTNVVGHWRRHELPIPATYGVQIEQVTGGKVTARDVWENELRARLGRKKTRSEPG